MPQVHARKLYRFGIHDVSKVDHPNTFLNEHKVNHCDDRLYMEAHVVTRLDQT